MKTKKGIILSYSFKEDIPKIKPPKEIADHFIASLIRKNSVKTTKVIFFFSLILSLTMGT